MSIFGMDYKDASSVAKLCPQNAGELEVINANRDDKDGRGSIRPGV